MPKNISFNYFLIFICATIFLSCAPQEDLKVDYSFEAAVNAEQGVEDFDQINFKPHESLDLGFYKGKVWVKLDITNINNFESYIVMTNDLVHRNYRFYKLDAISQTIFPITTVADLTKQDHRTYNYPKPNFKIDLKPNENAIFYMTMVSDGRILEATPHLLTIDQFRSVMNQNVVFTILFFAVLGMIFLINIFLWSIFKNRIYPFYCLYIIASALFYLSIDGYLYGIGLTNIAIDHLSILGIRIWIVSAALFSSRFLELQITNPKFTNVVKWMLICILGGTTLYQFLFFNTSVSHLHLAENTFGFVWIIISIIAIVLSVKKRKIQAKYYLLAFSFLLVFIVLGLVDSRISLLPGDPLFYFKIGIVIEFIGFTYFIALIIKRKLNKAAVLESELNQNKQELLNVAKQLESSLDLSKTTIEKTDLLNIFKLLETTLSTEKEWPEFKAKFEELSPNFLVNLKQAHPNLSKSEIRLLILIRIGFTQKEIAMLLNIVPDSVKKAKQRVRKKLNLPTSIKLNDYLLGFN